jgi:hypothetical protein
MQDCLTCNSPFILITDKCDCPPQTYFDGESRCPACDYTCLSCSNQSNNSCTTCNNTDNRTLINSSCPCNPFYMDDNQNNSLCI